MKAKTLVLLCSAIVVAGFTCTSCSGGDGDPSSPAAKPVTKTLLDKSSNAKKQGGGNAAPDQGMAAPAGVKTGTP